MQKKKFPVLPVIGIFAVMSVLFVMNATGGNIDFSKLFVSRDTSKEVQDALSKTSKETNKRALTQAMTAANNPDPHEAGMPTSRDNNSTGIPDEPAILMPKNERRVETPNESATSSQWYKDGAEVKEKGEEIKKERHEGQ